MMNTNEYSLLIAEEERQIDAVKRQMLRSFAKNLKKIRIAKGLTQEELGARSGLNYKYVAELENPKKKRNPSILVVLRLAEALSVGVEELIMNKGCKGKKSALEIERILSGKSSRQIKKGIRLLEFFLTEILK